MVFQWVLAVVFLIVGGAAIAESIAGGALLLVAAALMVPPVWDAIRSSSGFTYRKTTVTIAAVLGLILWTNSPAFEKRAAQEQAKRDATKKTEAVSSEPQNTDEPVDASTTVSKSDDPYADESKQYAWISVSEDGLKSRLKDAESAKFRNVAFYSGGKIPVVCGEVNARNGFGGYSGFEHFIAAGQELAFMESEVSGFSKVWKSYCKARESDRAHED